MGDIITSFKLSLVALRTSASWSEAEVERVHSFSSQFDGSWEVIYQENYETRVEALISEKQLKSYRGREFVKKHIPR